MWCIPVINGPNLNLTGFRETHIYGAKSFDTFLHELHTAFPETEIPYHQSNQEGQLISWLHDYRTKADAILLNPGGLTHTSISLRDAIAAIQVPVVEIHLSDIQERESFRQYSAIRENCFFHVEGYGLRGYEIALLRILEYLNIQ